MSKKDLPQFFWRLDACARLFSSGLLGLFVDTALLMRSGLKATAKQCLFALPVALTFNDLGTRPRPLGSLCTAVR